MTKFSNCPVTCPVAPDCDANGCALSQFIERIVDDKLSQNQAEEAAQWDRCFGKNAPRDLNIQRERIFQVASGRAALALLNKPAGE